MRKTNFLFVGLVKTDILNLFSDFVQEVKPDVAWRLIFSRAIAFKHIWLLHNYLECEKFGAWLLAHISQTGKRSDLTLLL
jgi:hypothetical protein